MAGKYWPLKQGDHFAFNWSQVSQPQAWKPTDVKTGRVRIAQGPGALLGGGRKTKAKGSLPSAESREHAAQGAVGSILGWAGGQTHQLASSGVMSCPDSNQVSGRKPPAHQRGEERITRCAGQNRGTKGGLVLLPSATSWAWALGAAGPRCWTEDSELLFQRDPLL